MIRNIQITKKGSESDNSQKTLFTSPNHWEEDGANLVLYKNNKPLKRDSDYAVTASNTVELSSSAKSSDELNFIITQIVDPSEMYSYDERVQQLDRLDKKMDGKAQTTIQKRSSEETIPSKFIIHSNQIWSSNIDERSSEAQKERTAKGFSLLSLSLDKTVAEEKGWYASSDGTLEGRVVNWIPPSFGKDYIVRLYDALDNEIPSSDEMGWRWDYQAGYLTIQNDFDYQTPFKISGFQYSGRFGVDSPNYWKEPIFSVDDLPLYNNDDGDIRLILTENLFYRYDSLKPGWEPLNYGSSSFRDPVLDKENLPAVNNMRGDIRLVLEESNLYVWDDAQGLDGSWILLTGHGFNPANFYTSQQVDSLLSLKSDVGHRHDTIYYRKEQVEDIVRWRPSRQNFNSLPPHTENKDGDVILTRDDNSIWRWYTDDPNSGQGHWEQIIQSNFSWKPPVDLESDLPIGGNAPGDVRLVIENQKLYFWDGTGWSEVKTTVADHNHDDRYMLKTELHWLAPATSFNNLPTNNNNDGDCRLTLDTNIIYRWDEFSFEWVELVSGGNGIEFIELFSSLPATADQGDVVYIKEYNRLYIYDGGWSAIEAASHDHNNLYYTQQEVDNLINDIISDIQSHTHDGNDSPKIDYNNLLNVPRFYWRNPVVAHIDLPLVDNEPGDARIVMEDKSIYVWTGSAWEVISSGMFDHDHNDSYYTKSEVNSLLDNIQVSFTNQLNSKADSIHDHDDRYYTKQEIDIELSEKADRNHTHNWTHDHDDRYPTYYDLKTPGMGADVHWDNIINKPASISDAWKTPVQYETSLPTSGNNEGDLRLVLDTSDVWRWDGSDWVIVGHWAGPQVDHWEAPVDTFADLPWVNNIDGDIRLVKDENKLYRWDEAGDIWKDMCCGDGSQSGGDIDDNDVSGLSYEEIQVYLNGIQGIEGEDWAKTSATSIRVLADVDETDIITILIIGDTVKRYDLRGTAEGTIDVNLATTFFRTEIELSVPTSLFTLPQPFNPGQKDLVVWLNGVLQREGQDYNEISQTEFLFDRMLDVGDRLIIVILGFTSGDGNYFREDYTAYEDQHTFLLANAYEPGTNQLLVYLNGQLQLKDHDYLEIDENTVQIHEDRDISENDYVTFIILRGLAIGNGGTIINYASDLLLGFPTDGSWSDGYVNLYHDMNVADAIDEINEALLEIVPNDLITLNDIDLINDGMTFSSGFVADGNQHIEGQPGDYFHYLTTDRSFNLLTPDNSFQYADRGVVRLFVNGVEVDSFNLGDAFVESDRNGSQVATHYGISSQGALATVGTHGTGGAIRQSDNGYIQIMSVEKYGYRKIQKGSIRFKLFNGIMRHGYNFIYATHSYGDTINTTKRFKFFVDTKHAPPVFTGTQTLYENNVTSTKYVSGVRYYSIGDSFRTTFNLSNYAYTVYSSEPVEFSMPGLKPTMIEYNDPGYQNLSDPPHIDDMPSYRGVFTLNEFNKFSIDGVLNIKTHTPFGPGEEFQFVSKNRLINTYTNGSTPLIEYFRDELFRIPADTYDTIPVYRHHIWDSSQPLQDGEAILFDKGLRYANMNFDDYMPAQTVDYSSFSGPQTYFRCFEKSIPRNNGKFIIEGITKNDLLSNKIVIDIKLPTQTGWLSLNKYYSVSEFDGEEGDGCLIDSEGNDFYYSSGTFSTAYSGYCIIMRITLPDDSAPVIKYMELKW
jgi:hypothetical protein